MPFFNLIDVSLTWYVLPVAFALDFVIGDPQFVHHPVRYMGRAVETLEPVFRRLPISPVLSGGLMAISLIAGVWLSTVLLLAVSEGDSPLIRSVIEIALVYFCIACRGLESSATEIFRLLSANRLAEAKGRLAMIVGRDVAPLDESGVARAAVETVAENFVDGVLAPLFFAAVGGAPLMMAYKMVNTLDSMVGYKNEKYRDFGKVAARIDDLANWIPARLSVPIIALTAGFLAGEMDATWKTARREGRNHSSPNAGWPEAAFAGALRVRLGGPNFYFGQVVEKPYIGTEFGEVAVRHIPRACDMMLASSLIGFFTAWGASVLL